MIIKKIILVSISILFCTSLFSQTLSNNFEFDENQNIIWRTINNTELDFKSLVETIETSGYYDKINVGDDYVNCEFKPYQLDFVKYGHKYMTTPFYISRNLVSANIKFEFKEGRYRVTIRNILFTQNANDALSQQGEQHSFEWWVLNKKGKIRNSFFKPGSDILNKDFKIKTSFTTKKVDENW